jgi:hypothetical protein
MLADGLKFFGCYNGVDIADAAVGRDFQYLAVVQCAIFIKQDCRLMIDRCKRIDRIAQEECINTVQHLRCSLSAHGHIRHYFHASASVGHQADILHEQMLECMQVGVYMLPLFLHGYSQRLPLR